MNCIKTDKALLMVCLSGIMLDTQVLKKTSSLSATTDKSSLLGSDRIPIT